MLAVLLLVLLVILIAMPVVLFQSDRNSEKKRREELQEWARQGEWTYWDEDYAITDRFDGPPFLPGTIATDVVSGTFDERRVMAFGYQNSASEDGADARPFRVFTVTMPRAIGKFVVKPKTEFVRLSNGLVHTSVQLESDAFNHRFQLIASSQKLAYDLMPALNIELVLGHPKIDLRTEGALLVLIEVGKLKVSALQGQFALLNAFIDNVPKFVWDDHDLRRSAIDPPAT